MDHRYYQSLIAKQALEANLIAFLPTGLGKTFVALFVLKQRLQIIRSSRQNSHKVILLIAPKKSLVNQHVHTLHRILKDVKVKELNGESTNKSHNPIDNWSKEEWQLEISGFPILAMTPAICRNMLEKNFLRDDALDFLILDECHYATGQDEMARVCDIIKTKNYRPLILGLTASPIKSKKGSAMSTIVELEERTMCTFFLPTQEFIDSLSEYKTRADSFIFHYGARSVYDLNPVNSVGLTSDESIHQHWQRICERLDLSEYVSQIIEHDRNFNTNIFSSLCHQLDPTDTMNLKNSAKFPFWEYSAFSLWKKFLNQALAMSRTSGLLAACIGLSDLLIKSGNVYRKATLHTSFYNIERCKPHKNDEALLQERIGEIVQFCEYDKSDCFRFLLDQRCMILVTLIEVMRCLIALMSKEDHPLQMIDNIAASNTDDIFGLQSNLKQTLLSLLKMRLCSNNIDDKEIWKEVNQEFGDIFSTRGAIFSIAGDIICTMKDYLLNRARQVNGLNAKQWLTFPLLSPRIQTLFRLLFALQMTQYSASQQMPSFEENRDLAWILNETKIGATSLCEVVRLFQIQHVQSTYEHDIFRPVAITFLEWIKKLLVTNNIADNESIRNHSVIIFCDLRQTTIVLSTLWNTILHSISLSDDIKLKCGILHGHLTLDEQKRTLDHFRTGKISILFSSEVAEEGIDIAKCRHVVHFDPPKTVKSQIQRRGRARAQDAQLIHLWPSNDQEQYSNLLKMFTQFAKDEEQMTHLLHDISRSARAFIREAYERSSNSNVYRITTSSGASIDIISAQELIFRYCFVLRERLRIPASEGDLVFRPYYRFRRDETHSTYAQLFLPLKCMSHLSQFESVEFIGQASSKRISQGLAALEAVKWLLSVGEIDPTTMRPITKKIKNRFEWHVGEEVYNLEDYDDDDNGEIEEGRDMLRASQQSNWLQKTVPNSLLPMDYEDTNSPMYHLYMYKITPKKISSHENTNEGEFTREKKNLQHVVILTQTPVLSKDVSEQGSGHPLTMHSSKRHSTQEFIYFERFGERMFSALEMHWIERFHRGIVCMETVSPEKIKEANYFHYISEYGFYSVADSDKDTIFSLLSNKNNVSHTTPSEWSKSGNGACYWVCPLLQLTTDPAMPREVFLQILIRATIEVETLMLNLQCIRLRNEKNMPFLDIILPVNGSVEESSLDNPLSALREIVMNETKRIDYVFTSSGNGLFRFKTSANQSMLLSEKMNACNITNNNDNIDDLVIEKSKTFAEHYRRIHHPMRTKFISECLEEESFGILSQESILYRGYMLSGRMDWRNLLQSPLISQDPMMASSVSLTTVETGKKPAYFLPVFSLPIGKLLWFEISLLVPGLLSCFQAMVMAKEVQERIFIPLLRPLSLSVPELDVILTAMTTTRVQQNLSLERLEFIGDSFLKLAASVYILLESFGNTSATNNNLKNLTVESLTLMRQRLITNEYLRGCALSLKLSQYIRVIPFSNGFEKLFFSMPGHSQVTSSLRSVNIQYQSFDIRQQLHVHQSGNIPVSTVIENRLDINHNLKDNQFNVAQSMTTDTTHEQPMIADDISALTSSTIFDTSSISVFRGPTTQEQISSTMTPSVTASLSVSTEVAEPQFETMFCFQGISKKVEADFMEALLGAAFVLSNKRYNNTNNNDDNDNDNNMDEIPASAWEIFVSLILRRSLQTQNVSFASLIDEKWTQVLSNPVWTNTTATTVNNSNHSTLSAAQCEEDKGEAIASQEQFLQQELSKRGIVHHNWRHPTLLLLSLTHHSYSKHNNNYIMKQDYEVLEFIGDAVLDLLVVQTVSRLHPDWNEHQLTTAKIGLVCNETLARHAERIGLLPYIRHENIEVTRWELRYNEQLYDDSNNAKEDVEEALDELDIMLQQLQFTTTVPVNTVVSDLNNAIIIDNSVINNNNKDLLNNVHLSVARKVLADVFEAIVGGIFIDSGGQLSAVKKQLQLWGYWREVEQFALN